MYIHTHIYTRARKDMYKSNPAARSCISSIWNCMDVIHTYACTNIHRQR